MSSQIEYLQRVSTYGADMYHLDVMDGVFTKHKSIDYKYLEQLREKSSLLFDCHLMIANPAKEVGKYIKYGADIISVHYESFEDKEDLIKVLKKIKSHNKMAGLCIDLDTDIKVAEAYLKYIDVLVIMTVKAGKGGQFFDRLALKKVKYIRSLNPEILIEVDGGINDETGMLSIKAGADILVSGSFIYNNDTYDAIQKLKGKNG